MISQVSSNYLTFRERSTLKAKDERIHDLEEEVNLNTFRKILIYLAALTFVGYEIH